MNNRMTVRSRDSEGRLRTRKVSSRWVHWFARKSWARITRTEFYLYGGFSNPDLVRKGTKTGWSYWRILR